VRKRRNEYLKLLTPTYIAINSKIFFSLIKYHPRAPLFPAILRVLQFIKKEEKEKGVNDLAGNK
jgi:hypothetical protein